MGPTGDDSVAVGDTAHEAFMEVWNSFHDCFDWHEDPFVLVLSVKDLLTRKEVEEQR